MGSEAERGRNRPLPLRYQFLNSRRIYLYPQGTTAPQEKLRLLYDCNSMIFLIEQAGGKALDGF